MAHAHPRNTIHTLLLGNNATCTEHALLVGGNEMNKQLRIIVHVSSVLCHTHHRVY